MNEHFNPDLLMIKYTVSDLPPDPVNTKVAIDDNMLTVGWDISKSTIVETQFIVTLMNVMTSAKTVAVVNTTQGYQFDLSQRDTCYRFEVRIAAMNPVGSSREVTIAGQSPVLPNNISHKVTEDDNGIVLNVTFKVC